MSAKQKITVAYGDGIGPEIMQATLDILIAAGAQIETEVIEIGEKVFRKGISTGIADESWESIKKNKVFLFTQSMAILCRFINETLSQLICQDIWPTG